MSKKVPVGWLAVFLVLSFALAGCGGNSAAPKSEPIPAASQTNNGAPAKPVELVIGHVVKTTDNFHAAALKFKEAVETQSKGQIVVTILPEGQAGPEKDLLTKTQSGELDGSITTAGSGTSFVPELGLFDLPWLFDSANHVHAVLDGQVGTALGGKIEQAGFLPIGILDFGFRHLTNSQRPVRTTVDVQGLKVRVLPNAIYQGTWEAVTGVKPIVLNWTDVPEALKSGTIDGQENPISILVSYKMWETQKYASKTGHVFAVAVFNLNPAKFHSLTPSHQQIVRNAGRAAVEESRRFLAAAEEQGWATLKANGMTVIEDVDVASFRKIAVDSVYARYSSQLPENWIPSVLASAVK